MNPRLFLLVVSALGFFSCGVSLKCTSCKGATAWSHCHVTTCSSKETKCFAEVHEHRPSELRIEAGCKESCKAPTHHHPDLVCHACCVGDKCNENDCNPSAAGVQRCHKCVFINNHRICNTERCQNGQVCFIQEFTVSPTNSSVFHHGGCTNEASCHSVGTLSFHKDYPHQQLQQGTCCNHDNCNTPSILPHLTVSSGHIRVNQCTKCVLDGVGWKCGEVDLCKANQVCYVQELELMEDIPGIQSTYFHAGCTDTSTCHSVNKTSVANEHGLARLVQGECCSSDNCNKNILTRYQAVQHCTKCVLDGVGWRCDKVDNCKPNQVCYAQELELTLTIPGLQATYFHAGCIDPLTCHTVNRKSVADEHGLARVIQGECCNHTDCNRNKILKYKEQYSTTTRATTTTTTTIATTTSTTDPPATTETGQLCQVCTGSECDEHAQFVTCSKLFPLCLTFLENEHLGKKIYEKRCATVNECDDKWLKETIIKPECIGFHPDSTYTFSFNCTFCCTTDVCNKDNIPSVDTLYFKS